MTQVRKRKVYLFNDTSEGHAGSRAVMRSLLDALADTEIIARHRVHEREYDPNAFDQCDAVLVNGEGTIHHRAPAGVFLMEMLELGQKLGKTTVLANALFQEELPFFAETLSSLDALWVREPRSAEWAKACGGRPEVLLDSCADQRFLNGRSRNDFAGAILKGDTHPFSPSANFLSDLDYPHLGLDGPFEEVVATLRLARLYITGQHHGVYAAGLAGVPFVTLTSNSHKIESLIEWSGLEIPICDDAKRLPELIEFALSHQSLYLKFQKFLRSYQVLSRAHVQSVLNKDQSEHWRGSRFLVNNEWQQLPMPPRPQPPTVATYDETSLGRKLIGSSCFFRNRPLLRTVLEQIDPTQPDLNVLFHAASIGCDPYSFCIAFELHFRDRQHPKLNCYATDLSPEFLEVAACGVYSREILAGMAAEERLFFDHLSDGRVRVSEQIRRIVTFLKPASYVDFTTMHSFDVVFVLNSLLYVSAQDQAMALDRIATYNGGLLITTGFHADQIQADLLRNGYEPMLENLEIIHNSWTCRRILDQDCVIEGITHYTPALPSLRRTEDYAFRFGCLFAKADRRKASKPSVGQPAISGNRNDTGRELDRLRDVVGGRPVAVLLHGTSIKELEQRVEQLAGTDFCFASLNLFRIMESRILERIGKRLSLVYCSSEEEVPKRYPDLQAFLARPEQNAFISTYQALSAAWPLAEQFRNKLVLLDNPNVPARLMPNSLTMLLLVLVQSQATTRIILFGADGLLLPTQDVSGAYYGGEILRQEHRSWNLVNDTTLFNLRFPTLLRRACHELRIQPPEILNCSPGSFLTPFRKVGYEDLLPILRAHPTRDDLFNADGESDQSSRDLPELVEVDYKGFNLLQHERRWVALEKNFRPADWPHFSKARVRKHEARGECIVADSPEEMKGLVDFLRQAPPKPPPEAAVPRLIREGVLGFNVVQYGIKFYALAQTLGPFDLMEATPEEIAKHQQSGQCVIADHYLNVLEQIERLTASRSGLSLHADLAVSALKP